MQDNTAQLPAQYVVTVGRSFGSGGRALGKLIADKLGIKFYDKELLVKAAEKAGMSPEYFERNDERAPRFLSGIFAFGNAYSPMTLYGGGASPIGADSIYQAQCDFIHEIAGEGPCVIVGRTADYVLRDLPNLVNIFVHAPMEDCVKRIVGRADTLSEDDARSLAERTNKIRASFYNFYTDKKWGVASSYDLTLDSSLLPLEDCADYVIEYIKRRFSK